jgi:nuclease S1
VSVGRGPRHRRHAPAAATLVLLALAGTARLSAWGAQGHHIVARIAWALMTPAARAEAERLLGGGQDVFVAAATWADDVRSSRPETYNWHFVDIPANRAHYDAARDCRPTDKGDCVIAEIARARAELADPGRPDVLKTEALKFLIHFVGDVHQPLHAIDNHDRGGNDVQVVALRGEEGRDTNLHAAWDTGLINLSTETEAARATRLLDDLKAHPPGVSLDVIAWAEESHDVARRVAYHYPGFSLAGPPGEPVTLDAAYRAAAMTAIDRQLELSGARLGALLNALWRSGRP